MSSPSSIAQERVCVLCGESLAGKRDDARFCGPKCRVESNRISAILSGKSCSPYKSIKDRIAASQKAYKGPLAGNDDSAQADNTPSVRKTAIAKLISDTGTGER